MTPLGIIACVFLAGASLLPIVLCRPAGKPDLLTARLNIFGSLRVNCEFVILCDISLKMPLFLSKVSMPGVQEVLILAKMEQVSHSVRWYRITSNIDRVY